MDNDGLHSLVEVLRRRAQEFPNKHACTFLANGETEVEKMTFGELELRSRAIAALLQRRHSPGERALLLYPPGLEFIAAFFGCLCAGIVAVPAYPPRPSRPERKVARLRAIVCDAEVSIVLCSDSMVPLISGVLREVPELGRAHWLATDRVPLGDADCWEEHALDHGTLALLQYTSGSTAEPKGVMVSHGNLLHNLAYAHYVEENDGDSVSVSWLPVYHDMGLIEALLQPIYGGYPAYLMSPVAFLQRPLRWLEAITRYRATNSGGPNFAFDLCVRKTAPEERRSLDLSSWRVAYNGAEPIRWETLERFYVAFRDYGFRWRSFYPVYGLAEATLVVSSGRQAYEPRSVTLCADRLAADQAVESQESGTPVRRITACGPFACGTRVVIARQDTGERCTPGEVGEIWVQSPSVAQGYWNRPKETRRTFHAYLTGEGEGPFLRTGDLGFLDRGELVITGRIKDLIIIRGRKHYPQDIERTVEESHEAILEGCVAAFGVDLEGEERLAVVAEVDRHRLRDFPTFYDVLAVVREMVVNQHEIPLHAVALLRPGSIPKTSSGKLKRYACRAGFLDGTLQPVAQWLRTVDAAPEGTCRRAFPTP